MKTLCDTKPNIMLLVMKKDAIFQGDTLYLGVRMEEIKCIKKC